MKLALTSFVLLTALFAGASIQESIMAAETTVSPVAPEQPAVHNEVELQKQRDQQVTVPSGTTEDAVQRVQKAGLMNGFPDGQFHGEGLLSRAELAEVLVKTFKLGNREVEPEKPVILKDVPSSHWAAPGIRTAVSKGVMEGYRDGYFYPEQRVNRAEAFAILGQAYGVQQLEPQTVQGILSNYPDAAEVPAWAQKSIVTSLKNGFVNVSSTGKINPSAPMTRQDLAYALSQYLNILDRSEQKNLH